MDELPASPQIQAVDIDQQDPLETEYITQDNPNNHTVQPHWRTLESGERIWVDGDGDSSINHTAEQGGGWDQSNPDYRTPIEKT
ncbi:hypothetical protein [Peribacillus loiseleuriae]|uniref:hypothetical protein n=1 Tax=Peribacillus loiseleuriae TaxID=1679170 RepID=UPI0015D64570|nr:hypothetical protein [Peribacillus loiseleuriae]